MYYFHYVYCRLLWSILCSIWLPDTAEERRLVFCDLKPHNDEYFHFILADSLMITMLYSRNM